MAGTSSARAHVVHIPAVLMMLLLNVHWMCSCGHNWVMDGHGNKDGCGWLWMVMDGLRWSNPERVARWTPGWLPYKLTHRSRSPGFALALVAEVQWPPGLFAAGEAINRGRMGWGVTTWGSHGEAPKWWLVYLITWRLDDNYYKWRFILDDNWGVAPMTWDLHWHWRSFVGGDRPIKQLLMVGNGVIKDWWWLVNQW